MWKHIVKLGVVCSILGVFITAYVTFRVEKVDNQIEKIINATDDWELKIDITKPSSNAQIKGTLLDLEGKVNFKLGTSKHLKSTRLQQLLKNNVQIIALVKPISEPLRWWPQPLPSISDVGNLHGAVRIGEDPPLNQPIFFDIVVLATPTNLIDLRETYESLPSHFVQSEIIRIQRLK